MQTVFVSGKLWKQTESCTTISDGPIQIFVDGGSWGTRGNRQHRNLTLNWMKVHISVESLGQTSAASTWGNKYVGFGYVLSESSWLAVDGPRGDINGHGGEDRALSGSWVFGYGLKLAAGAPGRNYGLFAPLPFRPLDDSPPGLFAPWLICPRTVVDSPHVDTSVWHQ